VGLIAYDEGCDHHPRLLALLPLHLLEHYLLHPLEHYLLHLQMLVSLSRSR
jgi:hypothetical protein